MLAARPPQKPSRLFTEVYGLNPRSLFAGPDVVSVFSGLRLFDVRSGGTVALGRGGEKTRAGADALDL